MKHFLRINIAVLTLLTASVGASAQTKSFFVPKEERTYAQKLGGYAEPDYDFVPLSIDYSKKSNRYLIEAQKLSSYEEAFEKLPDFPDPSDVDTREKMTDFLNRMEAIAMAVELHEPHDKVDAAKDSLEKAQMDNAKRAAKGLPYDSVLHFDPKAQQYQDLIYKRMNAVQEPVAKLASDIVNVYSQTSDPGYVDFILENSQAAERHFFEKMAPLRKQLCQEWFASDQCQEIDRMDAPLVERALAERPRKAPSWFIEGRKAELEYVQSYNRYITERWIAKVRPYYEKDKAVLAKLLPYIKELEALHGDDPITIEYVGARIYARQWIESMLCRCYEWVMLINYAPLIQTPPTYESVKKFNKVKLK